MILHAKNSRKLLRNKRHLSRRRRAPVIPRTVMQTSKDPLRPEDIAKLKRHIKGWNYHYFSDNDILTFFKEHPLDEFPNITEVFNSFHAGQHKADLFRYYYLYIKGGVFMDSDLMLYDNLNTILNSKQFVSIWALRPKGSVFNGFLAATPKHPIIYSALKDAYITDNNLLQDNYFLFVERLGDYVRSNMNTRVKMLSEQVNNDTFCTVKDPDMNKISLIHYMNMDIPDQPPDV